VAPDISAPLGVAVLGRRIQTDQRACHGGCSVDGSRPTTIDDDDMERTGWAVRIEILADVSPTTTRVAVVEDSELAEIYIETVSDRGLVGNIYKGRVSNIAPGMQAAFVDVGLEHDLFLPLAEIVQPTKAIPEEDGEERPTPPESPKISDLLKVGQSLVVQVVKEPVGTKGARATTHLTMPGRHLVLMPTCDHLGVSRRIADSAERERLKACVEKLKPPGIGLIVRTVAEGKSEEEFRTDVELLMRIWRAVEERSAKAAVRTLLYEDISILSRVARDLFSPQVEAFIVDSPEQYTHLKEACPFLTDTLIDRIALHDGASPLFDRCGVERAIERAMDRKVWLKSGGSVVIEETEALHSIDVNTGRFLGKGNLEETAFSTNLEATEIIARQVRLRNLAGIIVIDFIDMVDEGHKQKVMESLREAFKRDRARTNILELTSLGLVQMTRQRNRGTLASRLKEMCPHCRGEGRILSGSYLAGKILRRAEKLCSSSSRDCVFVVAHPAIARHIMEIQKGGVNDLETRYGKKFFVRADDGFHRGQFQVTDQAA